MTAVRQTGPAKGETGATAAATVQQKATRGTQSSGPRRVRFNVGESVNRSLLTQGTTYRVVDVIGEGAYGVVVSAIHRPTNSKVAIKKIAPFDHSMFALRTLRELKLLKYFAEEGVSENVRHTPPSLF